MALTIVMISSPQVIQWSPHVSNQNLPVEIVEEGEDEEGQFAPGLLQAELERVAVHHRCGVVQQLLGVRWGVKVPATGGKKTTLRVVDPFQTTKKWEAVEEG